VYGLVSCMHTGQVILRIVHFRKTGIERCQAFFLALAHV